MLLRWLVNNYLREAAEGKVREVVETAVGRKLPPKLGAADSRSPNADSRNATEGVPSSAPVPDSPEGDFLACDIAFIFALSIESGGLTDQLQGAETSRHAHGVEHAGKVAGREVVIVESGIGGKAAARATAEAIKFYQPQWIVSAGFAGALDDKLRRGHIVMAEEVTDPSGQKLAVGLKLDPATLAKGLHSGRLLTVADIIRQPEQRKKLAAEHGAVACDMETFAVAQTCREHGVRLLSVRIISDAVEDELPPEIEHLLAQKSLAAKLGAAAGAIFRRPSAAKDLWQLREDALKASDRLAKFLVGVVPQLQIANDK